jgi:hypothetical protein
MEGIESDEEIEEGNKKKKRKKEVSGDDLEGISLDSIVFQLL